MSDKTVRRVDITNDDTIIIHFDDDTSTEISAISHGKTVQRLDATSGANVVIHFTNDTQSTINVRAGYQDILDRDPRPPQSIAEEHRQNE